MAKKRKPRRVSARGSDGKLASKAQAKAEPSRSRRVVDSRSRTARRIVAARQRSARQVAAARQPKFGFKTAGAGVLGGLLLSGLFGGGKKTPEGLPPELQMQLAAALQARQAGADSGKNTTKTLQDIARLLAVLKGARDLAGVVTPPPFSPAQSNNPFGASGLVA